MKSNIKASMGKIFAEALRYYYFDRFGTFSMLNLSLFISQCNVLRFCCALLYSDELVEDAAGVHAGGRSFKEIDEEGFRTSEVLYFNLFFVLFNPNIF